MGPDISSGKRPRGPRRSPDEIRAILISAGVEMLLARGLSGIAEYLTFKEIYSHLMTKGVRLTNGSVIGRVFENQDHFLHQILLEIARSESEDFNDVAIQLFVDVIGQLDRSTEEARWFALSEICRVGSRLMMDTLHDSPTWRTWIGIWAMVGSSPPSDRRDELTQALRESYAKLNDDTAAVFEEAIKYLGFRLRKPYTMNKVASIITSLSEGSSIREFVENPRTHYMSLHTGREGENQKWSLFGIGFFAMVKEFVEIDHEWTVKSD